MNPPTAMILLDGRSVGSNPYVGTYPRDSQIHDLVVTAPGYQEIHQRFMLDRDMMLQLQMQKVPRKNEDAVATTRPAPARSSGRRSSSRDSSAQDGAEAPVTAPAQTSAPATPAPTAPSGRDGKRTLDGDVFDSKPSKRALDSDVFEKPSQKPSIDRDTPWKSREVPLSAPRRRARRPRAGCVGPRAGAGPALRLRRGSPGPLQARRRAVRRGQLPRRADRVPARLRARASYRILFNIGQVEMELQNYAARCAPTSATCARAAPMSRLRASRR